MCGSDLRQALSKLPRCSYQMHLPAISNQLINLLQPTVKHLTALKRQVLVGTFNLSLRKTSATRAMSEPEKNRSAIKRQLKPAPQRPGQYVHSPRLKSEIHFAIPGSIPDIGEI